MQRLHEADKAEVLHRQTLSPARVYSSDAVQQIRIRNAREAVHNVLKRFKTEYTSTAHEYKTIVELGANSCDISGHVSMGHHCHAWEVSPQCVEYITRNFPWVKIHAEDIEKATPLPCDLLILCEILEHLTDPDELVRKWLPAARYAVISSPLQGDRQGDLSGGEHVWTFDEEDFQNFVKVGGHEVLQQQSFQMSQYVIKLMITKRVQDV